MIFDFLEFCAYPCATCYRERCEENVDFLANYTHRTYIHIYTPSKDLGRKSCTTAVNRCGAVPKPFQSFFYDSLGMFEHIFADFGFSWFSYTRLTPAWCSGSSYTYFWHILPIWTQSSCSTHFWPKKKEKNRRYDQIWRPSRGPIRLIFYTFLHPTRWRKV